MAVSASYQYLYRPFEGPKSIRLVEISPLENDNTNKISCKLITTSLDSKPPYLALSYVWGDGTEKEPIQCNGTTFHATSNLARALRQLRSRYRDHAFWIDAICINQNDLQERAQQVQFMRDIYRSAENVVVYLGEESDGLSRAMKLFEELNSKAEEDGGEIERASLIRGELPSPYEEVWYRLHDFFNRPWFSRIWVVQEIVMASEDPEVICGSFTLRWSSVVRVAKFLHETAVVGSTIKQSMSLNAARMESFKSWPVLLVDLLHQTLRFESSEPRDKLFALYGIVIEGEREILKSKYFEVSYEKSVKDVYRDAVLGYIQHFGTLAMMGGVGGGEDNIHGLPSWVPNWTMPFYSRQSSFLRTILISKYDACGGQKVLISQLENPDILRVAGKSHDVVDWVAEPFHSLDFHPLPHKRRPQKLEKLWDEVSRRLGKEKHTCQAFWRTLIANVDREAKPVSDEYDVHFLKYWHDSKLHDQQALKYRADNPDRPEFIAEDEERMLFEHDANELNTIISIEEFEALKRYTEFLASQFLPCTSEPECKHCIVNSVPEQRRRDGLLKIEHHPAAGFRDTDPFIADYYEHLERDFSLITADANMHFLSCLRVTLPNRAFFITKGGLMGLGPKNIRTGDEVAVLSGSRVPFTLRNQRIAFQQFDMGVGAFRLIWQYRVMGECYVHGVMNGEAVEDFDWETEYEVFDLV